MPVGHREHKSDDVTTIVLVYLYRSGVVSTGFKGDSAGSGLSISEGCD